MKRWIVACIALVVTLYLAFTWAKPNPDFKASQEVIENWFAAMKDNQIDKAGSYLGTDFVSIHTDGITRNKTQELELIKNLHMKNYHLSQFKFSQTGNIMIVTFKDQDSEKIAAGRMAVLQKQNDKWEIIGYANLDKIS